MAGRDATHVALNDGLDRRFTAPVRYSAFVLHELDRQLAGAAAYWSKTRREARRQQPRRAIGGPSHQLVER
jgi:hypothetical protein